MSLPRAYIETTIPSFYHDTRTAAAIVARREWTRQWWSACQGRYELFTSPAVLDGLNGGPADRVPDWLALVGTLPLVPVTPAVAEIVTAYLQRKLMPSDPVADALHLALASYHKCDFLVTWS